MSCVTSPSLHSNTVPAFLQASRQQGRDGHRHFEGVIAHPNLSVLNRKLHLYGACGKLRQAPTCSGIDTVYRKIFRPFDFLCRRGPPRKRPWIVGIDFNVIGPTADRCEDGISPRRRSICPGGASLFAGDRQLSAGGPPLGSGGASGCMRRSVFLRRRTAPRRRRTRLSIDRSAILPGREANLPRRSFPQPTRRSVSIASDDIDCLARTRKSR